MCPPPSSHQSPPLFSPIRNFLIVDLKYLLTFLLLVMIEKTVNPSGPYPKDTAKMSTSELPPPYLLHIFSIHVIPLFVAEESYSSAFHPNLPLLVYDHWKFSIGTSCLAALSTKLKMASDQQGLMWYVFRS